MNKIEYMNSEEYKLNKEKIEKYFWEVLDQDTFKKVMDYLENKTDFLTAPASTNHHSNVYGGLVNHSIMVAELFLEQNVCDRKTAIICGLLHDVCKCNLYEVNFNKDGSIHKSIPYKINQDGNYGHGDKSVIEIMKNIGTDFLSKQEMFIIKWHMYPFDGNYRMHQSFIDNNPLIKVFFGCDMIATAMEELGDEV